MLRELRTDKRVAGEPRKRWFFELSKEIPADIAGFVLEKLGEYSAVPQ